MFKVTNAEASSSTIWLALDITIEKDGTEHELTLSVEYRDMSNFGSVEITWEVIEGDDTILEEDDMADQLDDFIQEYVYANIGKL